MALALLGMVAVVGPIVGPILGGWLTYDYSWPWIFFINIPIGIFAVMVVAKQLKDRPHAPSKAPLDYVGFAALVLGVGALQIVLIKVTIWIGSVTHGSSVGPRLPPLC